MNDGLKASKIKKSSLEENLSNYLNESKLQTSYHQLFSDLLVGFKQKASILDAMFSHIRYSDVLKERFIKANIFTEESSN